MLDCSRHRLCHRAGILLSPSRPGPCASSSALAPARVASGLSLLFAWQLKATHEQPTQSLLSPPPTPLLHSRTHLRTQSHQLVTSTGAIEPRVLAAAVTPTPQPAERSPDVSSTTPPPNHHAHLERRGRRLAGVAGGVPHLISDTVHCLTLGPWLLSSGPPARRVENDKIQPRPPGLRNSLLLVRQATIRPDALAHQPVLQQQPAEQQTAASASHPIAPIADCLEPAISQCSAAYVSRSRVCLGHYHNYIPTSRLFIVENIVLPNSTHGLRSVVRQ